MTEDKRFKCYVTLSSWALPLHIDWCFEGEPLVSVQFLCFNFWHGPAEVIEDLYSNSVLDADLECPCGKDQDDCPIHADAQG